MLLIEKNKMLRLSLSTERKFKLAFEFFAVGAFFLHFIFFVVKSDGVFFVIKYKRKIFRFSSLQKLTDENFWQLKRKKMGEFIKT